MRLLWLLPLFVFCPHSPAHCLRCCQLAPTLHLNVAYWRVTLKECLALQYFQPRKYVISAPALGAYFFLCQDVAIHMKTVISCEFFCFWKLKNSNTRMAQVPNFLNKNSNLTCSSHTGKYTELAPKIYSTLKKITQFWLEKSSTANKNYFQTVLCRSTIYSAEYTLFPWHERLT